MNKDIDDVMSSLIPGLLAAPRFSADFLVAALGLSGADNPYNLPDTRHWLSEFNGSCLKSLLNISRYQSDLFRPLGVPQETFTWWLKPLVKATQEAVAVGRDPDIVAMDNLRIEAAYAACIKQLVVSCSMEVEASEEEVQAAAVNVNVKDNGRKLIFNRAFCDWACEQAAGQIWLLTQLATIQQLEWQYHSFGQTRLGALKNLLRSLLQVIANQVFSRAERQPYRKALPEGGWRETDEKYLQDCSQRLLALLVHDAFDVRRFALESPNAKLGACRWEEVPGTALYSVRLRHYLRPEGIEPNGKTLYMSSPMINRCELFDLAPGKSVVEGMLAMGYDIYMVDYGNPGPEQNHLGLDFYGQTVHDRYLDTLLQRHPGQQIDVMAYCMGGTLFMPYLARRIEEAKLEGREFKVRQVVLMTTPILFDDAASGHKPMRDVIRRHYQPQVMEAFFGTCNVPPQTIELGMHAIQPGVAFSVAEGFYARANFPGAIDDAAPFLNWLHCGTRFPAQAHREWIQRVFINNEIWEGRYCLPSKYPELDGKPVNMAALDEADLAVFDYRGLRDPIAPVGSCKTSERWGRKEGNLQMTRGGLNRTIEKNVGHIFVVSKLLLSEFLQSVKEFLKDAPPPYRIAPMSVAPQEADAPVMAGDADEASPATTRQEPAEVAVSAPVEAAAEAEVAVQEVQAELVLAAPVEAVAESASVAEPDQAVPGVAAAVVAEAMSAVEAAAAGGAESGAVAAAELASASVDASAASVAEVASEPQATAPATAAKPAPARNNRTPARKRGRQPIPS